MTKNPTSLKCFWSVLIPYEIKKNTDTSPCRNIFPLLGRLTACFIYLWIMVHFSPQKVRWKVSLRPSACWQHLQDERKRRLHYPQTEQTSSVWQVHPQKEDKCVYLKSYFTASEGIATLHCSKASSRHNIASVWPRICLPLLFYHHFWHYSFSFQTSLRGLSRQI